MKKRLQAITGVAIMLLLFGNCLPSKHYVEITPNQSAQLFRAPRVQFALYNGDEYRMQIDMLDSLHLQGTGTFRKYAKNAWQPFSGRIPLDSVNLVLVEGNSFGNTFLVLAGGTALLAYWIKSQEKGDYDDQLIPDVYYPGGGSSSCPFLYSWNGTEFQLEGEAFGTALGKGLEMTSYHLLPGLRPEAGKAVLRIGNERPETHYLDAVRLWEVPVPAGHEAVLDGQNRLWSVRQSVPPLSAYDAAQADVLPLVRQCDRRYWECDLAGIDIGDGFESRIELAFKRPPDAREGLLIVDAINTEISNVLFQQVFGFLGEEALALYQRLDGDPEWVAILEQWRRDCSLHLEMFRGGDWQAVGSILPEANVVPFRRALRFDLPPDGGDTVRLRLSSMADVWRIDAVALACDPPPAIDPEALKPLPRSGEWDERLTSADARYRTLFPGQSLNLTFDGAAPADEAVCYVLAVRGYLHEWIVPPTQKTAFALLGEQLEGFDRLQFLKHLLAERSPAFLVPAYASWRMLKDVD